MTAQEEDQQQQQQPPQEGTQTEANADLKKAAARENLAFLTSGAKEKLDKNLAGMKGAAHIMTHPFNKEAKEEATAKTIERKTDIVDKQERIRATAHIQLLQEKAAADGVDVSAAGRPAVDNGGAPAASGRDESVDSGARESGHDTEQEISASGDKISEESSDGSSRGRAQALNQISPDSQDYQSG